MDPFIYYHLSLLLATVLIRERFALTVNPSTRGVAGFIGEKSVSVSDASRPMEFFAFSMNRIVVVSQIFAITFTFIFFEVAS